MSVHHSNMAALAKAGYLAGVRPCVGAGASAPAKICKPGHALAVDGTMVPYDSPKPSHCRVQELHAECDRRGLRKGNNRADTVAILTRSDAGDTSNFANDYIHTYIADGAAPPPDNRDLPDALRDLTITPALDQLAGIVSGNSDFIDLLRASENRHVEILLGTQNVLALVEARPAPAPNQQDDQPPVINLAGTSAPANVGSTSKPAATGGKSNLTDNEKIHSRTMRLLAHIAEHPELSELLDSGGTSLRHGALLALWGGIDQDFDIPETIRACMPPAASARTFDDNQSAKLTAMMKEAAEAHTAVLRKDLADLQSENNQLADQAMATAARHNDCLSQKRLSALANLRAAKKRVTLSKNSCGTTGSVPAEFTEDVGKAEKALALINHAISSGGGHEEMMLLEHIETANKRKEAGTDDASKAFAEAKRQMLDKAKEDAQLRRFDFFSPPASAMGFQSPPFTGPSFPAPAAHAAAPFAAPFQFMPPGRAAMPSSAYHAQPYAAGGAQGFNRGPIQSNGLNNHGRGSKKVSFAPGTGANAVPVSASQKASLGATDAAGTPFTPLLPCVDGKTPSGPPTQNPSAPRFVSTVYGTRLVSADGQWALNLFSKAGTFPIRDLSAPPGPPTPGQKCKFCGASHDTKACPILQQWFRRGDINVSGHPLRMFR
jgi:hypothetical protein